MADYKVTLTSAGADLLAKCISGKELKFRAIQLGDGDAPGAFADVVALASLKKTLPVSAITRTGAKVNIKGVLDFTSVTEDFQWREVGLIARDPDTQADVVYCYGNAGDKGDWITGGVSATAKSINITALVANASAVAAEIDNTKVYAAVDLSNVSGADIAKAVENAVASGSLSVTDIGAGDMLASVYDPTGKAQDVFAYADKAVPSDIVRIREGASESVAAMPDLSVRYTAEIGTSWADDPDGGWVQTVAVAGLPEWPFKVRPTYGSMTRETEKRVRRDFANVCRVGIEPGQITVWCWYQKPDGAIPIEITM